jgi:hypothetical protein
MLGPLFATGGAVDLAAALNKQVFDAAPEKFPQAYNVALQLVNDGVVNVLVDGQPEFSFSGPYRRGRSEPPGKVDHMPGMCGQYCPIKPIAACQSRGFTLAQSSSGLQK